MFLIEKSQIQHCFWDFSLYIYNMEIKDVILKLEYCNRDKIDIILKNLKKIDEK